MHHMLIGYNSSTTITKGAEMCICSRVTAATIKNTAEANMGVYFPDAGGRMQQYCYSRSK
eukprot:2837560-Pleurochrysis_carterae.AAC.1